MSTATQNPTTLKKTPFHGFHLEHSAKMVEYAGWEMPILYTSIIEEHHQVRKSGGFFDVSHMGRLKFTGRHARKFLDYVCTRQIFGMENGQCRYSLVCNEQGGCRDDVLVYRFDDDDYLMVCNAANRLKLLDHFAKVKGDMVFELDDQTESTAMCAIQGPKVMDIIAKMSREIPGLKRYRFTIKNLLILKMIVSRTGYTGEDGVEIIMGSTMAKAAMSMLLKDIGKDDATVKPIGLGARDSLRLEAGMPLYGHEITEEIDPLSAQLSFAVKVDKGDDDDRIGRFIGQEALRKIAAAGPKRTLIGLSLEGRRSARQGMTIHTDGKEIGFVTSGCLSPTLGKPIAMGYADREFNTVGGRVQVDLKSAMVEAEIVKLPFYKAGA
jgi:aminomethyltransferase